MSKMYTIVVGSGNSTRFGSNKLEELLGNETVLERSVRIAKESSDGVVLVVSDPEKYSYLDVNAIVKGGETRTQSVNNGITQVPKEIEIIAVHDAARPGATKDIYERGKKIIEEGNVAAIPAIDVVDTVKQVEEDSVSTIDRSKLRAVQTPQIFNAQTLRDAHQQNIEDTDDAALVESMGRKIVLFEGSTANRKVTTPEDIQLLRALLEVRPSFLPKADVMRIGTGYDIHPFSEDKNRKLVLGGVQIDHQGLEGHSDADAIFHAVTDAILSAIGAPDLGTLFPASEGKYEGASSDVFLSEAILMAANDSYVLNSMSVIVNAQEPKLSSYIDEMKKKTQELLEPISTPVTSISITPKHGEGVGEIGQGKAIAVYCSALLTQSDN